MTPPPSGSPTPPAVPPPPPPFAEAALAATSNGVTVVDALQPSEPLVYVNSGFERLTGYAAEEVLGRNCRFLQGVDTDPDAIAKIRRAVLDGEPCRVVLKNYRKDGTAFWNELAVDPIRNSAGQVTHFVGVQTDLTEHIQREEELREAEAQARQKYQSIVENSPLGIFQSTPEGRYISANPALARLYGYASPQELISSVHDIGRDIYGNPHVRHELIARLESCDVVTDLEVQAHRRDGGEIWISERVRAVRDPSGRVLFYEGTVEDITSRKLAETEYRLLEEQLRQVQKLEAVGRLAGGIAHDFNNLLSVVGGYGELLREQLTADGPSLQMVREILNTVERGTQLTRQLLLFSRKQAPELRVLDPGALLAGLEGMLRILIGGDITVATRIEPDVGPIRADGGQLEQVIMNLAVNARDAMPDGGQLTLSACNTRLTGSTPSFPAAPPGDYVRLEVSDNGFGMDSDTMAHVFEPFFTTRAEGTGTGLGLSIVYGIVRQADGHIRVESELGIGTTFQILFPRVHAPSPRRKPEAPVEPVSALPATILVVEDEPSVRQLVRATLQRRGFRVLCAADGSEAVDLCDREAAPIDLVLSDLMLPGLKGPELVAELMRRRPGLRILFMSGHPAEVLDPVGADSIPCLRKPFTTDALIRAIHARLRGLPRRD